jgi:hypothetical protein
MAETSLRSGLQALLAWLTPGVLLTAPIWMTVGGLGLALGLLGPLGILFFKPGDNLVPRLILVVLVSSPTIVGLIAVMWKWSRLGARGRILCVVGLSVLWHGIGAGLWTLILGSLN